MFALTEYNRGRETALDVINHEATDDRCGVGLELLDWLRDEAASLLEEDSSDDAYTAGYWSRVREAHVALRDGRFDHWLQVATEDPSAQGTFQGSER